MQDFSLEHDLTFFFKLAQSFLQCTDLSFILIYKEFDGVVAK